MARLDPEKQQDRRGRHWLRLHPFSGAAILLLDNFFFGVKLATAGLGMPITMTLAFWSSLFAVWFIQRRLAGEGKRVSFGKALASGLITAVPFSIAGTVVGGLVLASAGLSPWRRLLK